VGSEMCIRDRYGEALCMRAWAYFNAVRIYGKVPFIPESLTSINEVESFLESSKTYIDSIDIVFGRDGYHNDTIYNKPVILEKQYFNETQIIDYLTTELETKVKEVGVNHYIDNNDNTWAVTIWNTHAMNTLLGLMHLTRGDLTKAANYFEKIVYLPSDNYRYQLDKSFSLKNWRNIFANIDIREHIYTLPFNKADQQQHNLQRIFEPRLPNQYMLKPTRKAIMNWETIWAGNVPGDYNRGYGVSYVYLRDGVPIPIENIQKMLYLKSQDDFRSADLITADADTVVWKYSWNKDIFDQDANFIIYRAAGVHLWLAEAYIYWVYKRNETVSTFTTNSLNIINNGSNYSTSLTRPQLGVRGRVGFPGIVVGNINIVRDPFTNKIIGEIDLTGNFTGIQERLENYILDEKARELAFEGERFYELMRAAKRRNDPSFLANMVSQKYPHEKRAEIYNLLLDEKNWYIKYFD